MSTLIAHVRVVEGGEARFEALARNLFQVSHDAEPGLRHYEYWRAAEPRQYYALIACDDFRAFIAHQVSDHHEAASPELAKVIESLRLEFVDPVAGASHLPLTDMQDAPTGADELTLRYTERFAAEVQDWWLALR